MSAVLTPGRKMASLHIPLTLRRLQPQTYLGQILGPGVRSGEYIFGTPHGLLFTVPEASLQEPTAKQHQQLLQFEQVVRSEPKRLLYGGELAYSYFLERQLSGAR